MEYKGSYRYPKTHAKQVAFVVKAISTNNNSMITSRAFDSCFEHDRADDVAVEAYAKLGEALFTILDREKVLGIIAARKQAQPTLFQLTPEPI